MAGMHIGVAVEAGCGHYAEARANGAQITDFIEYGVHVSRGVPDWVVGLRDRLGAKLNLHPLDVNLADTAPPDDDWTESLARVAAELGASALVSDAWFWYHRHQGATWPRPSLMPASARACRDNAARIATACGLPFRVENPPVEWMPAPGSLWAFLEQASDHDQVEICLDLSHLIQFARNVDGARAELPRSFPWHKVTEIHLAGYVAVEYQGMVRYIDEHLADIPGDERTLLAELLQLRGSANELDVCLEMEPRSAAAYEAMAMNLRALAS